MSDVSLTRSGLPTNRGALTADRLTFFMAAVAVFLSPYNILRLPSIYFTAADGMAFLTFAVMLVGGRLPSAPFGRLTAIWYAGFLAIVVGMTVGGIVNQRLLDGADVILQYTFAMVLFPWILGGRDMAQLQRLLLVWVVSMVIVMLHGAYLINFDSTPSIYMVTGSKRLAGVVERENALAALGALASVVTMYLSSERIISALTAVLFLMAISYGIILTASNTGLIALVAGGVVFTVFQRSTRHLVMVAVVGVLAFVAIRFAGDDILPATFMRRVAGAVSSGDVSQAGTFDDRLILAEQGWAVSQETILIGLGANGFRLITDGPPVHNTYILLLVEGGILSLFGLCTIIAMYVLQGAALLRDRAARNLGAMVFTIGILLALTLNAFAHIYGRFWSAPLVLVMTIASCRVEARRQGRATPQRR